MPRGFVWRTSLAGFGGTCHLVAEVILSSLSSVTGSSGTPLRVSTEFETGNGRISYKSAMELRLDCDLRDSTGDRWYWHIAIATRDACVVRFVRSGLLTGFGPAVSHDGGDTWAWTFQDYAERTSLILSAQTIAVRLSATIPYGLRALHRFAARLEAPATWRRLTTSERGRAVPMLMIPAASLPRRRVVVAARHHACEAMASYVLEGLVCELADARAAGDPHTAETELIVVPMVDVDGVVAGDQGKGRCPHDHNRDYGPCSRYAAVRAIRRAGFFAGSPTIVLDLHTPGLIGVLEERPFLVASGDRGDLHRVEALADIFPPGHDAPEVMMFDEPWNAARSGGERCFAAWARGQPGVILSATVEFSNGVIRGRPVTPDVARAFGRNLASTLPSVFE